MLRRWSSNTWVLVVLLGVLVLTAVDVGRKVFTPASLAPATRPPDGKPEFQVGELAPDFTLPDAQKRPRRFSELVKKETLLCFTCGCANCRQIQTYMTPLLKKMGARAPQVISVSTMEPAGEKAYFRDTGLEHTLLYEAQGGPIMTQYVGHPCPRIYRLDASRRVTWIGPWMNEMGAGDGPERVRLMAQVLVENLGFVPFGSKSAGKPVAPSWTAVVGEPAPMPMAPMAADTPPDAHGHLAPAANPKKPADGKNDLPPYATVPDIAGS